MTQKHIYELTEIADLTGTSSKTIVEFVSKEWIVPAENEDVFDDEDVTRARLILDLRDRFGVNDEAVSVILHLVDQIHCLRNEIKKRFNG